MKKLKGNSLLAIILLSFVVVLFLGLFIWQIERYLAVTKDTKVQAQVSKTSQLIEFESVTQPDENRFAYLHSNNEVSAPLVLNNRAYNFTATSTLSRLFLKNKILPTAGQKESCYLYIYFPPGMAKKQLNNYTDHKPGFVVAGWSPFSGEVVSGGTPVIVDAVTKMLTKEDFYCDQKTMSAGKIAQKRDGNFVSLPGISFQFSGFYYSKVALPVLK